MVAVFHKIGEPTEDKFTHSSEQILNFDGQITFDGVYFSVYEHRQDFANQDVLLFITGSSIGAAGFCSKQQLLEMKELGFHLAWHGWSHRDLTKLPDHAIVAELDKPDWVLPIFAYPYGEFDERVQKIVRHNYYQAYSTTQGIEGDEHAIKREYI